MKKVYSLLAGFLISVSASVSAQTMQSFNPGNDPVSWGSPNESLPGNVYVSRYGYWRNQPVKMAYWTSLPHYQIPPVFHLSNAEGKIVYTGRPVWMRTPENAMVPVGILYPGARIYALNFSGFHDPGTYYIEMPGYRNSQDFRIRGYLPGNMSTPFPGQRTIEQDAGMRSNRGYYPPAVPQSYLLP